MSLWMMFLLWRYLTPVASYLRNFWDSGTDSLFFSFRYSFKVWVMDWIRCWGRVPSSRRHYHYLKKSYRTSRCTQNASSYGFLFRSRAASATSYLYLGSRVQENALVHYFGGSERPCFEVFGEEAIRKAACINQRLPFPRSLTLRYSLWATSPFTFTISCLMIFYLSFSI